METDRQTTIATIIMVSALVIGGAGMITHGFRNTLPLEETIEKLPETVRAEIWRADLVDRSKHIGSRCKISEDLIYSEPMELLVICDEKGSRAFWSAREYPQHLHVFRTYFNEPKFWEVLKLSDDVPGVIADFMEHGSKELRFDARVAETIARSRGEPVTGTITPVQFGLMAIYSLSERGHELLSEFVRTESGEVKRLRFLRARNFVVNFFTGSSMKLERVVVQAARSPTWGEIGGAALEVAVLGTVVASKILAPMKAATKGTKVFSKARIAVPAIFKHARSVGKSLRFGTVAKVGAVATMGAFAAYPSLFVSGIKSFAELAGVNPHLFLFSLSLIVLALVMGVSFVLSPVRFVATWAARKTLKAMWIALSLIRQLIERLRK